MEVITRLLNYWDSTECKFRPGASNNELTEFEHRYKVVLPSVVREYFLAADGAPEYEYDGKFCRFYPIGEVKPVFDELPTCPDRLAYPDCYVFAEWAVWCWGYAFRLTGDPDQPAPVFRVECSDSPGPQVAASFQEFLEQYLHVSDKVP